MAGFGDLLGEGSAVRQFLIWGVAYEVARTLLTPFDDALTQRVYARSPVAALTPALVADMVVRNIMTEDAGAAEAALSGINPSRFHRMVQDTGEPPGLELVLEMYRRGIIPLGPDDPDAASVLGAIRLSRLRDVWTDAIVASREVPLPPAVAVDAVVESQIDASTGATKAYASGVSAEDFDIMVHTRGNPPSPTELLELYRRGFIPATGTGPDAISVQQGIYEGATKNKWYPSLLELAHVIPPPRTVTTLLREGVISQAKALQLFGEYGLDAETAAAYVASATASRTSAHKQLAESQVLQLYEDKLLSHADAVQDLINLGYPAPEAALLLDLRDYTIDHAAITQARNRVRTLYTTRKIDQAAARSTLAQMGIPDADITTLLATWDLETAINVKDLTEADVASALFYEVIDQPTAMGYLERMGYTPYDAWVKLSVRNHAPLPNPPPPGPGPSPWTT